MKPYDIIILGGGASGLCTAVMAKTKQNRILLLEHGSRIGKKILATGNGKCNLTNLSCRVEGADFAPNPEGIAPYYSSGRPEFAREVIRGFDAEDTIAFFESLGMLTLNKNGYIYPRSEQASSVLDLLRLRAGQSGVEIRCDYEVSQITAGKDGFRVDDAFSCQSLVLAAGGKAAPKTGSDGTGYSFARRLGHRIVTPVPALCALACSDPFLKELKGVRTDAELKLYDSTDPDAADRAPLMTVFGNLQFQERAVSGIPVFQLSLAASRLLAEGKKLLIRINLLPEISDAQLAKVLKQKLDPPLLGTLNKKLALVAEKESRKGRGLFRTLRALEVHPVKTASFEEAQTTLGGVSTEEIDPSSMESKLVRNLYLTGEMVDVSGICGGYNLQWAFATAHAAAKALRRS